MKIEEIYSVLEEIKKLNPYPGTELTEIKSHEFIFPDVFIDFLKDKDELKVFFDRNNLVGLRISDYYQDLKKDKTLSKKNKKYLQDKLIEAKTLISAIDKRMRTIYKIAVFLSHHNQCFFKGKLSSPHPLSLKEIRDHLNIHESTISRAIKNKYLKCIQGIFPFKFFITTSVLVTQEDKKNQSLKEIISSTINSENKYMPLSDEKISQFIYTKHKISIARRTITKYRQQLGFPSAKIRKRFQ